MKVTLSCMLLLILSAGRAYAPDARWISLDPQTQRYRVAARDVARAELLAELEGLANVAIRPHPDPSQTITLAARGLTLEELVRRILGPETDFVVRLGTRDVAAAEGTSPGRKEGPPAATSPGRRTKRERSPRLAASGNLKPPAGSAAPEPTPPAGEVKPRADNLARVDESRGPKKAVEAEVEEDAIRITLRFVRGAPPVVVRARPLEGRPVHAPYVTGRYLFVVLAADGRPLEYGTLTDPLEVHSYRREGDHSVAEADSGLAGLSIARERLAEGRLLIVDLEAAMIDDELSEQTVREAIARGRTVLDIDLGELARSVGPGDPR